MKSMHRIVVSGRVQQVGYRDYIVRKARSMGVTGWVRNLSDGRVEILADADPDVMKTFLEICHEGPSVTRVTDVTTTPVEEKPVKGFTKRFTV